MKQKSKDKKIGSTVEQIVKWYEDSIAYQTALGLRSSVPQCVKFYEGDQWEPATKNTKHFPRPVVNITELICNNKKSQVLSSPIKLVYDAEQQSASVEKFNRFAEYEQGRLRQTDANDKACLDGIIKGSYCFYYYWDSGVVGIDGLVEGDMGLQVYEPLDVHFADPSEKDEQKQEWIMLVSREDVEKIKEIADKGIDESLIQDDEGSDSIYNEPESETTKYATTFTRFFRHNGEVYYERATRSVMFNEARPFTPNPKKAKAEIEGREEEEEEPRAEEKFLKDKPRATLYPLVFSSWKQRDKSIYGRGEVEKIIPNQKAINWNWGLQLLMAQDEAMGVTIVKEGALKNQTITNEPGQVITDHSHDGNGIRRLERRPMSQGSAAIADKLADVTRVVTGASEIMNGELIASGMSGAAIAQLQAQALKPIEDLQKGFWRSMERAGEIYEQFFRFFYTDKKFQYKQENNEGTFSDSFNSDEYKDMRFDVKAEAVAGTVMSDVADINILDNLFAKQAISLKTYITCYPQNAIANRQKLLDSIEAEQQEVVSQLQAQLQQAQMQLEQITNLLTEQEETITNAKKIIGENFSLKEELLSIQSKNTDITQRMTELVHTLREEYTQKINLGNKILEDVANKGNEYLSDAQRMAMEIARQRGLVA